MTIWKKAISAVTSAALLASLLATSAFAVKGTAPDADLTNYLNCSTAASVAVPKTCSQVADGVSTVTLIGEDATTGTNSLYISASGASIIGVGPAVTAFTLAGGIVTTAVGASITGSTITLRSPAAPGTAVVSVFEIAQGTGIATLEGTLTITFTATSGLAPSEANSTVKFVGPAEVCSATAVGASAPKSTNAAAKLCVLLKNANGTEITTGAKVKVQITPVGLTAVSSALAQTPPAPLGTAQIAETDVNTIAGWYAFSIGGSGLPGVATIGISVTVASVVTTFAPKTFTFSDVLATITATALETAFAYPSSDNAAIRYTGKDAAGNNVYFTATATSSNTAVLTIGTIAPWNGVTPFTKGGEVWVNCLKSGSADVVVKSATGTLPAAPIKVYCSDVAKTFTVKFDVPTVNPGGSATFTVSALDANGLPAVTSTVTAIVSSGAITPGTVQTLADGIVEYTYLAPFNTGVATALATVSGITGSKSASINIGTPANVVSLGSTASTLGVAPPGGSWSTSTKVAKVGSFITWRFAAGVANAGKTIGVFLQTKNSSGVWSAPVRFSARVADSSGNAYFSWRGTKAMWVSIRGGLGDARSNPPVQGRWQ